MSCPYLQGRNSGTTSGSADIETESKQNGDKFGRNEEFSMFLRAQSEENIRIRQAEPAYYHSYLDLDKILDANHPRSAKLSNNGVAAHDEHLFITIHQSYELWFKQILYELNSCIKILCQGYVPDRDLLTVNTRIHRINVILKVSVDQFAILETMTPLDFLDFRRYLSPASGFQSVQFRILENRLGLTREKRMRYNKREYDTVLSSKHSNVVQEEESKITLFEAIETWLERCPYTEDENWSFWHSYKRAVNNYIEDEKLISHESSQALHTMFETIFNPKFYQKLRNNSTQSDSDKNDKNNDVINNNNSSANGTGKVRLSYKAMQAALLILCHRDEPILQMPFKIIDGIMELEQLLTKWRNAHALMVHRMLGSKLGTGGSSGFHYLRTAALHHKVFTDFFNLSTYMIPKSYLPKLPKSVQSLMNFVDHRKSRAKTPDEPCLMETHDDGKEMANLDGNASSSGPSGRSTDKEHGHAAAHRQGQTKARNVDNIVKAPVSGGVKLFAVLERSVSGMTLSEAKGRNKELGMQELQETPTHWHGSSSKPPTPAATLRRDCSVSDDDPNEIDYYENVD